MGGDRWLQKKISVYASGVTLKYQSEVAGSTSALYAAIPPRMSILEAYPPIPLSVVANWSAKMRGHLRTGNQYCVPRRPNKRDVKFAITSK